MARIVVVGAGLGGLAVAARLAKQRHQVTVVERSSRAGGAIHRVERDGYTWEAGPASTALPAVLRDLFRKSGRPLERYVTLEHRDVARRHVFTDGRVVDLPTGSRGGQIDAIDAGLGAGLGLAWASFVDSQADVWATLRTEVLENPRGGARLTDRQLVKKLGSKTSLEKLLAHALPDMRLRQMASHHVELMGSHPRDVAGYAAVDAYVERSFGVWSASGGMSSVIDALVARLDERAVELRYQSEVVAIEMDGDQVRRVVLAGGDRIAADAVVTDIDPRVVLGRLLPRRAAPVAARAFEAAHPALPPQVTHLGLTGDLPDLPPEVVLHGDPVLRLTTTGDAPPGGRAWTILSRGGSVEDVLVILAARGLDLRPHVAVRIDRSAADLAAETAGSPYGIAADGWKATARRAAHTSPVAGLYLIGASTHPGAGVPYVGWGAAHAAQLVSEALVSPART